MANKMNLNLLDNFQIRHPNDLQRFKKVVNSIKLETQSTNDKIFNKKFEGNPEAVKVFERLTIKDDYSIEKFKIYVEKLIGPLTNEQYYTDEQTTTISRQLIRLVNDVKIYKDRKKTLNPGISGHEGFNPNVNSLNNASQGKKNLLNTPNDALGTARNMILKEFNKSFTNTGKSKNAEQVKRQQGEIRQAPPTFSDFAKGIKEGGKKIGSTLSEGFKSGYESEGQSRRIRSENLDRTTDKAKSVVKKGGESAKNFVKDNADGPIGIAKDVAEKIPPIKLIGGTALDTYNEYPEYLESKPNDENQSDFGKLKDNAIDLAKIVGKNYLKNTQELYSFVWDSKLFNNVKDLVAAYSKDPRVSGAALTIDLSKELIPLTEKKLEESIGGEFDYAGFIVEVWDISLKKSMEVMADKEMNGNLYKVTSVSNASIDILTEAFDRLDDGLLEYHLQEADNLASVGFSSEDIEEAKQKMREEAEKSKKEQRKFLEQFKYDIFKSQSGAVDSSGRKIILAGQGNRTQGKEKIKNPIEKQQPKISPTNTSKTSTPPSSANPKLSPYLTGKFPSDNEFTKDKPSTIQEVAKKNEFNVPLVKITPNTIPTAENNHVTRKTEAELDPNYYWTNYELGVIKIIGGDDIDLNNYQSNEMKKKLNKKNRNSTNSDTIDNSKLVDSRPKPVADKIEPIKPALLDVPNLNPLNEEQKKTNEKLDELVDITASKAEEPQKVTTIINQTPTSDESGTEGSAPRRAVLYGGIQPNFLVPPTTTGGSSNDGIDDAQSKTNIGNIDAPKAGLLDAPNFAKAYEEQVEKSKSALNSLQEAVKTSTDTISSTVKEETTTLNDENANQMQSLSNLAETHQTTSEKIQEYVIKALDSFKGKNKILDIVIEGAKSQLPKLFGLFEKTNSDTKENTKQTAEETAQIVAENVEKTQIIVQETAEKTKDAVTETGKEIQEVVKSQTQERIDLAKSETDALSDEKERRVGILGDLAKAYQENTGGAKDAINGLLDTFKGNNGLVNGLLDVAKVSLPKLFDLFSKTNKDINKNVEDSTKDRNDTFAKGAQKTEETAQGSLEKIQSYIEIAMEAVNLVFEAINASIDEQIEEADEKYKVISEKYDEVANKVEESNNRIKSLNEDAKNAQGGRLVVIQEQISREIEANKELADEEKQLAKDKEKAEQEKEKLETKKKKNELKQQLVQTIANTATGVMKAVSASPLSFGLPWSAFVLATGAIQIANISKQISKLADGGLLNGKAHAQGGMRVEGTNIEVEGGEYVVNRASTRKNLGLVSYINSQRRELTSKDLDGYFKSSGSYAESPNFKTMFAQGGVLPAENVTNTYDNDPVLRAVESINLQPVVSVVDIANVQQNVTRVTDWTNTSSF